MQGNTIHDLNFDANFWKDSCDVLFMTHRTFASRAVRKPT